ncbi:MAG TPA: hypothetical protein DC049_00315 [Spirochaetia bacterium]|nr:hypothetical protein [Spirochaetia bacterium]
MFIINNRQIIRIFDFFIKTPFLIIYIILSQQQQKSKFSRKHLNTRKIQIDNLKGVHRNTASINPQDLLKS